MQELVDALVAKLAIDARQARGGAAVLFRAARTKLGAAEFDRLLASVRGLPQFMLEAPPASGLGRLFGGLASAVGGSQGALVAEILSGFGSLGLSAEHAKKFVPVITEFLHARVGPDAVATLERALRA